MTHRRRLRVPYTYNPDAGQTGLNDPARHHEQVKFQFEENHPAGNDRDDGKQRVKRAKASVGFYAWSQSVSCVWLHSRFEKSGELFLIPQDTENPMSYSSSGIQSRNNSSRTS